MGARRLCRAGGFPAFMQAGLALGAMLLIFMPAPACSAELAGVWQEYDDQTGKVEALIRIEQTAEGVYEGKIIKLMADVLGSAPRVCGGCRGELRNRPLLGMRILYGMKRRDELNFEGGEIIDPEDGKVYRCQMKLSADGLSLKVTGYLGISWFGETETWQRAE